MSKALRLFLCGLVVLLFMPSAGMAQPIHSTALSAKEITRSDPGIEAKSLLFGSALSPEGLAWNTPGAYVMRPGDSFTIELESKTQIRALVIQADHNDSYFVEASDDGLSWRIIWAVPPSARGAGIRSRFKVLDEAEYTRFLRVRPGQGDGSYSVGGFLAFSKIPPAWEEEKQGRAGGRFFVRMSLESIDYVKEKTALLGAVLLLVIALINFAPELKKKFSGLLNISLASIGLFSAVLWWNLGLFHFPSYVHHWDFFHYYIGAKYLPELGYERLYDCTTVADIEAGHINFVRANPYRNLQNNRIESSERIISNPEICKSHFSEQRWQEFSSDVLWFRNRMGSERWASLKQDHGFNATPVWSILGRFLSLGSSPNQNTITNLAAIDSLILVVMWALVWWAFGWKGACVAAIYWGTNYPARFFWTGGSFLRQDWLMLSVASICFLKKGYPATSGALLSYAALLRIFPGFIGVAFLIKILSSMIARRSWNPQESHRRFILGGILSLIVLVGLSIPVSGRLNIYGEFINNSKKHVATPLTNNMGLKTLLSYDHDSRARITSDKRALDPFAYWKTVRQEVFSQRVALFYLAILIYILLLWRSSPKHPDWVMLCLGAGLIPIATEITCYYYSILLIPALLWIIRPQAGIVMALVAWLSYECARLWGWYDELFTWASLIYLAAVYYIVWDFGRNWPRLEDEEERRA